MRYLFPLLLLVFSACLPAEELQQISLLDGTPSTLEQFLEEGKPAVLNFWAASCAFCRHELPLFEAVHQQGRVTVIGINLQERPSIAKKYWEEGGYTFRTLLDPSNELRRDYRVSIQPTTIFLNAQHEVIGRKDGPLDEKELRERVEELLNEEKEESDEKKESRERKERTEVLVSPVPPRLQRWYKGDVQHLIELELILSGGPPKDGIPSIDDPKFIAVQDADYLPDDAPGILLKVGSDVRYYPYAILNWHEIVNDTVGGKDVTVTYCPLCATGVVYGRQTSAGTSEFGVSGLLYQSNLLMYDRNTDSLWNQVSGQAVVGPLTGKYLEFVRSDIVRFSTVKRAYPQAKVLSDETGFSRDYTRSPYGNYMQSDSVMFPVRASDDRLHPKALVYGVLLNGRAKAYPESVLREEGIIEDQIHSVPVRLQFTEEREELVVERTDTGEDIAFLPVFWFSWVAQYPETELYE